MTRSQAPKVKALGKVLTAFYLWQGNMSVCDVCPLEREGVLQLKNGLICLEQAYCFQALTAVGWFFFFFFWSKNFLAFDLSRWVGLCRVFSLVCGVSALPLQRQDVISVMSVQGFTVSY